MRGQNVSESLGESRGQIRGEIRSESRISSPNENYQTQTESDGMEVGYDEPQIDYGDVDTEMVPEQSYSKREVVIKPLNSGFLVNVGCQSAAVETNEQLIKTLTDYFENPYEFEKKWFKNNNRNKL
jgi:hypothetical protein